MRSAARSVLLCWPLILACESVYSLPPTPCDDHCNATQRETCDDEDPAECVRKCEETRAATGACMDARDLVNRCLMAADDSGFRCVDGHTEVLDICLDERSALSECWAPGSAACFAECLHQVDACGASLRDCEEGCHHVAAGCEAASAAYYACLVNNPTECREWLQQETRDPEDIPCYPEALEILACAK